MTNPPQGSDESDERPAWPSDAGRWSTEPVPSFDRTVPPGSPPDTPYGEQALPYVRPAVPGAGAPAGPPRDAQQRPPQYGGRQYGSPEYGAPAYAPPPQYGQPGPAPQKSKVGLIAAVTGLLLLVIAGAVVLIMALQSRVLDRGAVERDVAAQFEQREGVAITLQCADDMTVTAGATYECTGTTADDEPVTLQITIADEDAAAYTWTEP